MSCPYANKDLQAGGGTIPLSPGELTPNNLSDPTDFSSTYAKVAGRGCAGTRTAIAAAKGEYNPYSAAGGNGVCLAQTPLIARAGPDAGYASVEPCRGGNPIRPLSLGAGGHAQEGQAAKIKSNLIGGRRRRTRRGGRRTRGGRRGKGKKRGTKKRGTKKHGTKKGRSAAGLQQRRNALRRRGTRVRGTRRYSRGTRSKTHSGKDFETRKTSKRYSQKGWRKYLRGRRTVIAPDFPFVGGKKVRRGGAGQPYSNIALAYGYGLGGTPLSANQSALATPPPQTPYDHCKDPFRV